MFQNNICSDVSFSWHASSTAAAACIGRLKLFTFRSRSCRCRIKIQDKSCRPSVFCQHAFPEVHSIYCQHDNSVQYLYKWKCEQMCERVQDLKYKSSFKLYLIVSQYSNSTRFLISVPQTPLVSSHHPLWTPPRVIGVSAVTLSTLRCSAPPPWAPARVTFTRPSAPSARPSTACPHPSPSSARPWVTRPWAAARPLTAWPSDRASVRRYDITLFKSTCFGNDSPWIAVGTWV